jgi:hypothetical protein
MLPLFSLPFLDLSLFFLCVCVCVCVFCVIHLESSPDAFFLSQVLYIIFLAPCLWFLFKELLTPTIAPGVIPMTPSVVGLVGFVLTVFGLYGVLRLCAPRLGWKYNIKTAAQHKEDLLRICRLSTALGVVGR